MTRFLGLGALTAALAAVLSAPATAAFVIDDFTKVGGATNPISRTSTGSVSTSATAPTANIVGGVRDVTLNQTVNPFSLKSEVEILTGPGALSVSNAPTTDSTVTLRYDGVAGPGSGDLNADFTDGGTLNVIRFGVLFDDLGFTIRVTVFDGTTTRTVSKTAPIVNPLNVSGVPVDFNFSEFVGVDFTSVNTFQVELDSLNSSDYIIDYIVTTAVPEPASIGMAAAGLVAVGGFARRRFAKKA